MLRVRNQRASKARSPYAAVPNGTNTVASSSVLARGRRGNRRGGQVRQPVANISNINAPPTQATPPTPAAPTTPATQASTEAGQGMSRSGMIGMIPHNMPPIVNPTPDAPSALSSHVPTNMNQGVSSLVYQHTVFQRDLNPVHDNGASPFLSSTVSTVQACVNKCHNHPSCESLVYDKVSSQCSLFDGKDVGEEITSNQIYNRVANKTVHQNIIAYANHLCNGDSPGYFYNESVPVCYKIDTQPRSMNDAVMFCEESGGHLLRIDTEIKQKFVESLNLETTSSISKYRIDGKKMNTFWTFSNDQPITRCYWYPGEPSANLASIGLYVGYGGQWDDISPTVPHGCICEKDINFN